MNAQQLFQQDGTPTDAWFCGKCNNIRRGQDSAEKCCIPPTCSKCGATVPHAWLLCSDCDRQRRKQVEDERLDKAELLTDYDGWIWTHQVTGTQDGYFESVEAMLDYIEDEPDCDRPEFVFACVESHLKLDISNSLDSLNDEGYEEMLEHTSGMDELWAAVDAWNELNKNHLRTYIIDYSKKVAVPK